MSTNYWSWKGQELAGLMSTGQSQVHPQSLLNKVCLLAAEIQANPVCVKPGRLEVLYVKGGCTIELDGSKVLFFILFYVLP